MQKVQNSLETALLNAGFELEAKSDSLIQGCPPQSWGGKSTEGKVLAGFSAFILIDAVDFCPCRESEGDAFVMGVERWCPPSLKPLQAKEPAF